MLTMAYIKVKLCDNKGSKQDEKEVEQVPAKTVHRLNQYSKQGMQKAQVYWRKKNRRFGIVSMKYKRESGRVQYFSSHIQLQYTCNKCTAKLECCTGNDENSRKHGVMLQKNILSITIVQCLQKNSIYCGKLRADNMPVVNQ